MESTGLQRNKRLENTLIYICTHKDFDEVNINGTILSKNELTGDYVQPVVVVDKGEMPNAMCEVVQLEWMQKHCKEEWIGLQQYRRYFVDIEPDTTILTDPYYFNMNDQYAACHNIEDLLECEKIIDEKFPSYSIDYQSVNVLYPHNMFVMKKKDFQDYCKFIFGVLDEFEKRKNLHTDEDVMKYVESNIDKYRDKRVDYQARLFGFLMERLSTIFYIAYFKEGQFVTKKIIQK